MGRSYLGPPDNGIRQVLFARREQDSGTRHRITNQPGRVLDGIMLIDPTRYRVYPSSKRDTMDQQMAWSG